MNNNNYNYPDNYNTFNNNSNNRNKFNYNDSNNNANNNYPNNRNNKNNNYNNYDNYDNNNDFDRANRNKGSLKYNNFMKDNNKNNDNRYISNNNDYNHNYNKNKKYNNRNSGAENENEVSNDESESIRNSYPYNNNEKANNIIYQDFYYREINYGSSNSSSNRSSLNNQNNINLNNYGNQINNLKEPEDEFSKYIFNEINNIRRNPKSFIPNIQRSIHNVIINKRNNAIYKGKQNILLNNGVAAFENTIKHLKNAKNMNELIYSPKMCIKLPFNEEEINNRNYLHDMVHILKKNKISITSFWREVIKDPEECFLLMIVDDCGTSCGFKRKDLLNPNMKYIGINSAKIGKYFSCYITLSEK